MIKKNKVNLTFNKKSIYYNLKEFYDKNPGVFYSYQDLEVAGIIEFRCITNKVNQMKNYERNRVANELMKLLLEEVDKEEKIANIKEYVTSHTIIHYYESFIKLYKDLVDTNNNMHRKIKDIVNEILINSESSEEVKFALIISPIFNLENIDDILEVFSIHNDYLFYVIKAYEHLGGHNNIIFEIAKKSKGYGKVFCVMNLRPTTYEIKKWLIEKGCLNDVGVPELLSYSMLSIDVLDFLENTEFDCEKIEVLAKSFSLLLSDYGLNDIKHSKKICNKLLEIIDKVNGGIYSLYVVISILYSIESIIIEDYQMKKSSSAFKFNNEYKGIVETCKKICKKDIWHEIISKEVSNIEIESSVLISCAEKTKYKLRKKEFEVVLKRDFTNALLYKYAFSTGNRSIKKCALKIGLQNLPLNEVLSGQDEIKIEKLAYGDIAQICFFIIIKYAKFEDFEDKYKDINLQALKAPLIETRIQAATNLQRFREEFDSLDKEIISDAISTEMVKNVRRTLNSLLIKTKGKVKKYVEVHENMHIDAHVKDVYLITISIAGTAYIDMSEVYNKLLENDILYLKREPNNAYDTNAIEIITPEGYVIGYVPKENNFILKNLMDNGKYLYGTIKEISDDYNNINVEIYLSYKDVIEEITTTLSLLSGEREQYLQ